MGEHMIQGAILEMGFIFFAVFLALFSAAWLDIDPVLSFVALLGSEVLVVVAVLWLMGGSV